MENRRGAVSQSLPTAQTHLDRYSYSYYFYYYGVYYLTVLSY